MVTVGFIVEGSSEKIVVESDSFAEWLGTCGVRRGDPVVNARGQLGRDKIADLAKLLRKQAEEVDRIVLMRDLDPDIHVQCVSERKRQSSAQGVDVVVIARKAIESWFLADSRSMRKWTGDATFFELDPEDTSGMPWERLKDNGRQLGRGPGHTKVVFAKKMVKLGFSVERAAAHPCCRSAAYFVQRVCALGRIGT